MTQNPVVKVLSKSLKDENIQVRKSAVRALVKIGTDEAIESLEKIKDDGNNEIRELVIKSLKRIKQTCKNDVPLWNEYRANLDAVTPEQKKFYEYWLSELEKNNFVDLGDNLSYIFAYLYSVIYDFIENEDIKFLMERFEKIMDGYGDYSPLEYYLNAWKADAHLFLGNYEDSLTFKKKIGFSLSDLENYGFLKEDCLITGEVLVNFKSTNGLTDFGKRNKREIAEVLDGLLTDFKNLHGKNIVRHFLEDYNLNDLSQKDMDNLKEFFEDEEEFQEITRCNAVSSIDPHLGFHVSYFDLLNLSKKDILRLEKNFGKSIYQGIVDETLEFYKFSVNIVMSKYDSYKLKLLENILEKEDFLKLQRDYSSYLKKDVGFGNFYGNIDLNMIKIFENYNLEELEKLEPLVGNLSIESKEYIRTRFELYQLEKINANKRVIDRNIFSRVPKILTISSNNVPYEIAKTLETEIKRLIRESENIYREKIGLPKIGEGWISETELYYKIKEVFPEEKVIQHGRPSWLGLQHLDIYFPEKNIAIEYQGLQHDQPVELFGGYEAFKKNQERDKRKKLLCEKNNCNLIYVYPEYNFEEVIEELKKLL